MHEAPQPPIELSGATNFRSLGGLPAAHGRRIRPYALMRADRLHDLTEDDWARLSATGLATIVDLRSAAERSEHPNATPARLGIRELHCEIRNDIRADPSLVLMLARDPTERGAERLMIELYRRLPRHMGGTMRTMIDVLLDDGAPLLVHCSAGKDRTGFAIAMLLHSLAVPEDLVWADYLASRRWPGKERHRAALAERVGGIVSPAALDRAVDAVLDVRESYLASALTALLQDYGSIERYLELEAGLDADRRERLRTRLLR